MTALNSWFSANKMTLNTDKSTFTIVKSSRKIIPKLPKVIKFLGLEIIRSPYINFGLRRIHTAYQLTLGELIPQYIWLTHTAYIWRWDHPQTYVINMICCYIM